MQGTRPGTPVISRPALTGWNPSTSFAGSTASITFCVVDMRRQRQLHQDAVDGRIGVEPGDKVQKLAFAHVAAGSAWSNERMPASTVWRALLRT